MAKSRKKKSRAKRAAGAGNGYVHPIMQQAVSNGARLEPQYFRGTFEVAQVENPYGEVIIRGELRRHKAIRRVPHFETLYRSKVIDRTVFVCLEWYAGRLALAQSGMIRCGLDTSGSGGGSAAHHIPTTEAAMHARSDVAWARGFIPDNDLRAVFDGVMDDGDSFAVVGARVYPNVCADRAKRKASSAFKIAANYLLMGVGGHVVGQKAA
ncbi:hypothetical protein [Tsuneonella suprasediminis]|uniref:hypothetical protein n=1 Tax=Tsuneonella suprasediminis TaxID=2306996 RepID=UPI002F924E29